MDAREECSLDKWLRRLSHFSQFGLFLFTLGTLYLTVLPLYQKALLDEAIARKEVELNQANKALEKAYRQLRTWEIKGYAMNAIAKCSDNSFLLESRWKKKDSKERLADHIFKSDIGVCLEDLLKTSSMAEVLHSSDYEFLIREIREISIRLEEKKRTARLEHDT